jgi:hypothetical protein
MAHVAPGCCPPGEHDHARDAAELRAAAAEADPELEACCRRDLQEQAREAAHKARLAPGDRSQVRARLARAVLGTAPPPRAAGGSASGSGSGSDDLSDDGELARLRALRLEELQRAARATLELHARGAGTLAAVSETGLLRRAEAGGAACLVAHLAVDGVAAGLLLDEHLESLAARFPATSFIRCAAPPPSRLPARLGLGAAPGLVCLRGGAVVGAAPLEAFSAEDGDLREEAVDAWLRKRRALGAAPAARRETGSDGAASSGDDSEDVRLVCVVQVLFFLHGCICTTRTATRSPPRAPFAGRGAAVRRVRPPVRAPAHPVAVRTRERGRERRRRRRRSRLE